MIAKILRSLILSGLTAINSFSTTYYISTSGSDSNDGLSLTTTFATIPYAVGKAVAGDIIYVRGGTYHLSATIKISKAGTNNSKFTLSAYPDDITSVYPADGRPLLDFSSMAASSSNRGFNLNGANNWVIYGLRINGAGDNGMYIGGTSYTLIEYCTFSHNRDGGCQIGAASHNCTFVNCDSYENADMGPGTTSNGGNADGFAPKLDVGDSIIYRGCRSWGNSDDGWDGYLRPSTGMLTILENCWTWHNGYYWKDGSTTSNMNGNGFKLGGCDASTVDGKKRLAHNFRLINCLSVYNKAKGFDQNNNAGSIWLYNCTGYMNIGGDFQVGNGSLAVYAAGSEESVVNCVTPGTLNSFRIANATTNATAAVLLTNNFAADTSDFLSIDSTGLSAMRKSDGSLPDIKFMHLKVGGRLVNKGTLLNDIPYNSGMGIPYNGPAPDLGCFETTDTAIPITYTITSTITGSGKISFDPSNSLYNKGSIVKVIAQPDLGYTFHSWSGDISDTAPTITLIMNGYKTINAEFIKLPLKFSITLDTVGSGNVTISPSGTIFTARTQITLKAQPNIGYKFVSWSGDTTSNSNPIIFNVYKDISYVANFAILDPILIKSQNTEFQKLHIFPTIVSNKINLQYFLNSKDAVNIAIYDILGKKHIENSIESAAGENIKSIDLTLLKPGVYFLKFSSNANFDSPALFKVIKK